MSVPPVFLSKTSPCSAISNHHTYRAAKYTRHSELLSTTVHKYAYARHITHSNIRHTTDVLTEIPTHAHKHTRTHTQGTPTHEHRDTQIRNPLRGNCLFLKEARRTLPAKSYCKKRSPQPSKLGLKLLRQVRAVFRRENRVSRPGQTAHLPCSVQRLGDRLVAAPAAEWSEADGKLATPE